MTAAVMRIIQAVSAPEIAAARELFEEYAFWLGLDLSFQNFDAELAGLPGEYSPPHGALLLALDGAAVLGCVAVRPTESDGTAELKRLYVRPIARGQQVGRALTERAIALAREAGYRQIRLDTLPVMSSAQVLYESLGFRGIEPYRFNPVPGARYLELDLGHSGTADVD